METKRAESGERRTENGKRRAGNENEDKLYKIGVNFNTEKRNIDDWRICED